MRSQSDTLEEALKDPFSDSVDFLDNDSNGAQYQDFSRSETFDSGTTAGSAIGSQPCVYVGLRNQGATCYLNSLLQVLFHLGKFRSAVYMMSTLETQESIGRALQTVFYQMQFLSGNDAGECATTTALTQAFGWTDRDVHVQHDIQELATKLRDTLTEDMKGTEPAKIINGLFEGIQEHVVDCCDGSYTSRRRQAFYDVQLCIKRVQNVYESLDLLIQKTRLDGENKYKLEHDDGRPAEYKDALKYTQVISFPPVLMLHLERTIMDMTSPTLDMVKLNDLYEYPETLNLAAYLPSGSDPQLSIYDLYGVIVHQGTVQFGHYLAFIRPGVHHTTVESWNWNPWHEFNDSCVRIASSTSALNDLFGGNDFKPTAYMLIYVRRSCVAELFPQSSHIPARRISRHDSPPDYIRQEVENNLVQDRIRKDHQAQKVHQIHIRVMNDDYIRREVYLNQWDILTSPFMESSETQKENASFKYSDKRRQIIDEVEEAATVLYVVLEKTSVFSALVEHVLKHWSGLNSNELRFRPWSFHYPQMKLSYRLAEVITEDRWGGKLCDVLGPYCNWPPPQCCQPGTCDVFLELPRFYMPRYILNVAPDGHATTNVSTAEGYDAANALCHYDEERSFVGTLGNSNQARRKRRQPEISPHDRRFPTGLEGNRVDAEEEEGDDGDDELDTACIVWSLDLHREYIIERIILQSRQFLPPPEEITIKLGRADGSVVWQHSIRYLPSLLDDVEPLIVDGSYQLKSQNRPQTEHEFDNPSLHCSAQYVEISKAVMRSSNGLSPATLALAEVQVHIDPSQAHSTDVEEMSCFNSAPPLPPASVLLLFVKLYDPIFMRLTYGGLLYVDPSDTLECYESQFRCLLKVGVGVKIRVFDEARYDLVHELNMHCPIRYLNLHTGNIITVQPFYTTTIMDKPPMCPTAVTYYEFLKTMRVVVCIPRPLTSPQKEGLKTTNEELCPECMTLEMCGSDSLGTITRRISDALPGNSKVDPRKIRLYGYDPATDGPAVRSCASTASVTLDVLQNSPWSEFSLRTPCYVWYEILDDAEVEDWEKHGHIIVDIIDDRFCARTQTIELEHYPRGSLVGELLRNETIRRALDTMVRMRQRREGGALSTSTISTPEVEYCLTRVDVESCAIEYIYASTDTVPLDLEERVRLEIHAIPPFHADCDKALQRLVCGCFHSPNGGSAHSFPFLCYIGSAHTLRQLREYLCTQCFAPSFRTEITGIGYGEDCGLGLTIHSFSDTSLLSPNTLMAIEEVGNFSNNSNTPPGAHLPLPHEDTTVIMKVLQPEKDQLVVFRPRPRERYGVYRCIPTSEPELILCKPNTRSS